MAGRDHGAVGWRETDAFGNALQVDDARQEKA
jgi:hypothetical protein